MLLVIAVPPVAAGSPEFSGYTCEAGTEYRHKFIIRSTTNSAGFTYGRAGATYFPTASCIPTFLDAGGAFVLPVNLQNLDGGRVLQIGWGNVGTLLSQDRFYYTPNEDGVAVAWPGAMALVEGEAYAFAIEKVLLAGKWASEFRIQRVSTGYTERFYGTWKYVYDDLWAGYETHDRASGHGRRQSASLGHQIRNIRYTIATGPVADWDIVGATVYRNFSSIYNTCWGSCILPAPRPFPNWGIIGTDGRFNAWHATGPAGY